MTSEKTVTRRGLLAGAAVTGAAGTASAAGSQDRSEESPENVMQERRQESNSGIDAVALVAVGAAAAVGGFGGAIVATSIGGGSDDMGSGPRPQQEAPTGSTQRRARGNPESAPVEETEPACPACGATLRSADANFCGECGEPV